MYAHAACEGVSMSKVLVPLAKGFEEIEGVTIIDILRRAEIDVTTAGVGKKLIVGAHNVTVQADAVVADVKSDDFDMIILPGGWDGTYALADDADVQRLLKEFEAKQKKISAICAAPFALNKAGVLSENFTCYPSVEEQIRTEGYTSEKKVVVDGNVMTSRGPGTASCFAFEIVRLLKGDELADGLKAGMLFEECC